MPKAKRGDLIVVSSLCSYTTVKMKKVFYKTFTIAKAASTKDGIVTKYREHGRDKPTEVRIGFQTIYTLFDDKQPNAARLFNSGNVAFDDIDSVRNAILEA